ncbi:DUF5946 family protein [Geodermatophilus sp. SYSU D00815]
MSAASSPAAAPALACPGCGSVLAPLPGEDAPAACARLYEETLRGLREDAAADPAAAAAVRLADDAYAAQHPGAGQPEHLAAARQRLAERFGAGDLRDTPPAVWRTTIADVAADLDVVDLTVLVGSWARAVAEDWAAPRP